MKIRERYLYDNLNQLADKFFPKAYKEIKNRDLSKLDKTLDNLLVGCIWCNIEERFNGLITHLMGELNSLNQSIHLLGQNLTVFTNYVGQEDAHKDLYVVYEDSKQLLRDQLRELAVLSQFAKDVNYVLETGDIIILLDIQDPEGRYKFDSVHAGIMDEIVKSLENIYNYVKDNKEQIKKNAKEYKEKMKDE